MPRDQKAQEHLDKANKLADDKKFNAAFIEFERAIRHNYGDSQALYDFGYALYLADLFPEAADQIRKAVEFGPADFLDVGVLVDVLFHHNRKAQQLEEFQNTVDKKDEAAVFHNWAQVLVKLHYPDRAVAQFRLALRKEPELDINHESLAQALKDSNASEKEVNSFQEEIDKLNSGHAWNKWGQTLLALQRYSVAAKQFEKAAKVRSDWTEPYINWGRAVAGLGDYKQAIDLFDKALDHEPDSVDAYLNIGNAFRAMDEHDHAIANYQEGATEAFSEKYFAPWLDSLSKLPSPDRAIKEYQQALEDDISEPDSSTFFDFGKFLKERGRLQESAIQFARSISGNNIKLAASQLREALTDLVDREPALKAIQEIVDDVNTPDMYCVWGTILADIDEVDWARQQLPKMVAQLSSIDVKTKNVAGFVRAFKLLSDRQSAQQVITEAISKLNNSELPGRWARSLARIFKSEEQALGLFRKVLLTGWTSDRFQQRFVATLRSSTDQSLLINNIEAAVNDTKIAAVSYNWALILINLKKPKLVIQQLKRVIYLEKDHVNAHCQLARLYSEQGDYLQACREFEEAFQLRPDQPGMLEEWGTTWLKAGDRGAAIQKYLDAVTARTCSFAIPDRVTWDKDLINRFQEVVDKVQAAETYQQWGVLLRRIKRTELAIPQFKRAITLDPDMDKGYSEWLKAIAELRFSDGSVREYEDAIKKYRNTAAAYNELGLILYALNRLEESAKRFQGALQRDPLNQQASEMFINCLIGRNDMERARATARQILVDNPFSDFAYNCLGWAAFLDGDYDESARQYQLGIDKDGPSYLYYRCARALFKSGREDLGRKKIAEALEKNPDDVDIHYEYGLLLMDTFHYDEAEAAFQKVVKLKPDHVYANHNLAEIPSARGRYAEARGKWMHAISIYEQQGPLVARVIDGGDYNVDNWEALYHASILSSFHKLKEAELVLMEGLEFDPYSTSILGAMAELNWEKMEEIVDPDADIRQQRSDLYWEGMKYFQRAEKLLTEASKRYSNYDILMELGNLYLSHKEYDKARPLFEAARVKDDKVHSPYAQLGVINLRERQPAAAIPLLLEALKRNPDELDVKSSLAEAYLRAEKLEDADTTYREVLTVTPNHVQSSIGLGELCTVLGDKNDSDRFPEAIEHFTRALEVAENEKIRSKYLKASEKAGVYYQRGYARVQLYESLGVRKDPKLLEKANDDFKRCLKFNPSHQKAKRAKEKIDKRLAYFSRDQLTETVGPRTIYWMAIIVFVSVQLAFYLAPFLNHPSLILTDKSLQAAANQVSPELLKSLEPLKNRKFDNREQLSNAVQSQVKTDVQTVTDAVLKSVEVVKPVENFPELAGGYYALLTFGSLLFMVVGLYLPQILKLRVAGIELEKSSIDQAGATGTLGISSGLTK